MIDFQPFGQLLENVVDNRGRPCPTAESGLPLIATNCISNDSLYPKFEKVRYVDDETYENWFRGHPESGDMIFVLKGTPGRVAWVPNPVGFCIAQDMVAIRADASKIYPKYLFATLRSKTIQQEIEGLHVGTLIPHFKKGDFDELQIPIIEPRIQEYIGDQYFNISLKIDLLQRQNATLEALAQTLFRQWFVEEAGDDWEEIPLQEVTDIAIGRTPPRKEFHWFSDNPVDNIKWMSIKDLGNSGVFISDSSEYLTNDSIENFRIPLIPDKTVVLSFKMTVGRVAITDGVMTSNEAIAHFRFRDETPFSKEYLYFFLKLYPYEILGSTSSIVTSVNSRMIKAMEIPVPDSDLMDRFSEQVETFFDKIRVNQKQVHTLEKLRDTLLPKLMSGEVRIDCVQGGKK